MPPTLLPRPLAVLAATAAVALPVAGCGGGSSSAGGAGADPAGALPASSPIYVEARVRPEGELRANLEVVGRKLLGGKDPASELVRLVDQQLDDDGASYERDIAPWLGDRVGIAVVRMGARGKDSDTVAALISKDDDQARAFVAREKHTVRREYRGVEYRFRAKDDEAATVLDGRVLVGSERGLKAAIDATKGDALAEARNFQEARQAVSAEGIGFLYLDPQRLLDGSASVMASGSPSNAQGAAVVKSLLGALGLRSVAASVDVRRDAIVADTALLGLKSSGSHGDGPGAAASVPAGAWLSAGVGDLGGTVQRALGQLDGTSTGGMSPQALLQQLKSGLGLDLERDFLSWMGDAAIFVEGTTPASLRGAVVVHSKDPAASKRAIVQLRRLMPRLGAQAHTVRGLPAGATGLRLDASGVPGGIQIAAKGDRFVIGVGQGAVAAALAAGGELGSTQAYRQASALLGGAKTSFFLNTPKAVQVLGAFTGDNAHFRKAKPTLEALGPVAAGAVRENGVTHIKAAVSVP